MTAELTPADAPRVDGMPMLGLGTWQNTGPEQCAQSVQTALETGYRHVDTAKAYGNEAAVGEGIARADVPREEVFLGTKLWLDDLAGEAVLPATERSLDRLGVEYLDVLYVHWPAHTYDPEETMSALAEARDRGLIEHVGVSNFEPEHLDRAQAAIDAPIFANQVEMHPFLQQDDLRAYAEDAGITLVGYSPLARGAVFDDPTIADVAEKHDASAAQVSLAWVRSKGVTAIPKATSAAHIRDNWGSLALDLDDEDVAAIDSIQRTDRQIHPGFGPSEW